MKRLSALVLAAILMIALETVSFAEGITVNTPGKPVAVPVYLTSDPAVFEAMVPTSLALFVDGQGEVSCPSNLKIANLGAAPVKIAGMEVKPEGSWEIVSWNHDMKTEPAGTGKIALEIEGSRTNDAGRLEFESESVGRIESESSVTLSVDAHIPVQTKTMERSRVMNIIFTLEWV